MKNNTPLQFALQLGAFISLYLSVSFLLVLVFGIINLLFPDPAEGYYMHESASSSVRLGIAMVLVFFPTHLYLTRVVNRLKRIHPDVQHLKITKWLLYLSLLVGAGALLIDLVIVIMTYLEGDVTSRFIAKALAVLGIIGAAVHYYTLDVRGYWITHESKSTMYGMGVGLVAFTAIAYGFATVDSPSVVRAHKLDATQITDLQSIQYKIEETLAVSSSSLPATLEAAYGEFPVPTAPAGRPAYRYNVTDSGFELCATFAADMQNDLQFNTMMLNKDQLIINRDDWNYKVGEYCFKRILNK